MYVVVVVVVVVAAAAAAAAAVVVTLPLSLSKWSTKYCDEFFCQSVCLLTYLENHMAELRHIFCAC